MDRWMYLYMPGVCKHIHTFLLYIQDYTHTPIHTCAHAYIRECMYLHALFLCLLRLF